MARHVTNKATAGQQISQMTTLEHVFAHGHTLGMIVVRSTALHRHRTATSRGMGYIGSKNVMGMVSATTTLGAATVIMGTVA